VGRASLCALILLATGCDSFGTEQRIIADRVVRTVRELREAPPEDKPPRLALLKTLECGGRDVCDYKRECVEAYELYVKGHEATRAARRVVVDDAGLEDAKHAAELLETAEKDVKRGSERATKCAELEGKVTRNYQLDK
jgi:hypothetical protein